MTAVHVLVDTSLAKQVMFCLISSVSADHLMRVVMHHLNLGDLLPIAS
jgi:hypothetical protein